MKDKNFNIRLDGELAEAVTRAASASERTVSQEIRFHLRQHLPTYSAPDPAPTCEDSQEK
jgi:predicted HicB family RNase H-like nuclease